MTNNYLNPRIGNKNNQNRLLGMFELEFLSSTAFVCLCTLLYLLYTTGHVIHSICIIAIGSVFFVLSNVAMKLLCKKSLREKNVLLTGGANGIGKELAFMLVKEGCNLIVWDNKAGDLKLLGNLKR